MRLKKTNCFSVRRLELQVAIQIWVFRNKKYDNISVLKVHSIDFHDKRIKTVSYANRNLLKRKIILSYFFGNNEW